MSSEVELSHGEAVEIRRGGLLDVQRRYRQLGRLRMGEKGPKGEPRKRKDWRLTSPSDDLLRAAAELYGGEMVIWQGAPTEGTQYELATGTDRLDVLVAPGEPLSQHWEMWSGGGCVRRCNGVAQTTGEHCACPVDLDERLELAQKGQACKPTTRLSVILPRIPDVGVWRLDSHGMNAAVELPGTVDLLRMALEAGQPIPAQLRIEQRTSKKDGKTRHFVVPVLELPSVTVQQLMSGQAVPAIGAARPAAIAAAPTAAIDPPKPPAKPKAVPAKSSNGGARRPIEAPPLPTDDAGGDEPSATSGPPEATPAEVPPPAPPKAKPAPTGDLTVFQKSIAMKGRRVGIDGPELDAVVRHCTAGTDTPRQALLDVTEPGEANAIHAALEAFGRGELLLTYADDGTPHIEPQGGTE